MRFLPAAAFLILFAFLVRAQTVHSNRDASALPLASVESTITVQKPRILPAKSIRCLRVPFGKPDDYKPCLAQLPDGELIISAFHQENMEGGKVREHVLLFRSRDEGKTWSEPETPDLLGREPYLTVLGDGTILMTGHLLAQDVRNVWGYTCGFIHRSTDRGHTWQSTRIDSESIKQRVSNHSSRNIVQLKDGTLFLGVDYDGGDGPFLAWRSSDNGKTWDKTQTCTPNDFKSKYGFFGGEAWLWVAKSGTLWALVRVDSADLPIKNRSIISKNDHSDHCILYSSTDNGKTFNRVRDLGDYGEMYMSMLRLHDQRLLLTFTVRDLVHPLGVRAITGVETADGFDFDFSNDRIMIDSKTPAGKTQGGGFGPTIQLKNGTLVTSYSYRGTDEKTHLEVVHWALPGIPVDPVSFRHAGVTDAWSAYGHKLRFGKNQTLAILDDGCTLSMPEWSTMTEGLTKVIATYDSVTGDTDPRHEGRGYHGSTIGIPSSVHYLGRRGVAFNNQVAIVRALECCHCSLQDSKSLAAGLEWVINNHQKYRITAINLAPVDDMEHPDAISTEVDAPLKKLRALGIWVSAPSGNHAFTKGISWPACQPDCYAIGAVIPGKDEVHLDRSGKLDLVVPAAATSSSNAIACGAVLVLREAIEHTGYVWQNDGPTLPDAMLAILKRTGQPVHDKASAKVFRRLNLKAALDEVFAGNVNQKAQEPVPVFQLKLNGTFHDSSINPLTIINHGVSMNATGLDGKTPAAAFDGLGSHLEVRPSTKLSLGTRDFTIALGVNIPEKINDDIGDLATMFDTQKRVGFNLGVRNNTGVTSNQANTRQLQFGIDSGSEPRWKDEGRPGNSVLAFSMAVHNGTLFAGTASNDKGAIGHVYRYGTEGHWIDCGAPDTSNAVTAMAAYNGQLHVGTGKYRFAGSAMTESDNSQSGGAIFRLENGNKWKLLGRLPDTEAVGGMVVYKGQLYASSLYKPSGFFRLDGNNQWTSLPTPQGKRVESMAVHNGYLWAGSYDGGTVNRFDGTVWKDFGQLGNNTQTYSFAVYQGELCVGTWPSGHVYRLVDNRWDDMGRLGNELEVMGMLVHNGKLYAGTLPLAEVHRYDGPTGWTKTAQLDSTPNMKFRRAWTMAQYQGKLMCSTLPSGRIFSLKTGESISYDQPLPSGWHHIAAVRDGNALRLHLDGTVVAESSSATSTTFDLTNGIPLKLGAGSGGFLKGSMSDVRIYRQAFTKREIESIAHR